MPSDLLLRRPTLKPDPPAFLDGRHPLARSLIRCWLFYEAAGTVVRDLAGRDNITLSGTPTWKRGPHGGSNVEFPGSASQFGTYSLAIPSGTWSVEIWFFPLTTQPSDGPILADAASTSNLISFGTVNVANTINWANGTDHNSTAYALNQWGHSVGVLNQSTGSLQLYRNGKPDNSFASGCAFTATMTRIGADTSANNLNARVGLIRVWNRGLTAGDVQQLYQRPYDMFRQPSPWWAVAPAGGTTVNGTGTTGGNAQTLDPPLLAAAAFTGKTSGLESSLDPSLLASLITPNSSGTGLTLSRDPTALATLAFSGRGTGLSSLFDPALLASLTANGSALGRASDTPAKLLAALVTTATATGRAGLLNPSFLATLVATGAARGQTTLADPTIVALTILLRSGFTSGRETAVTGSLLASLAASGQTIGLASPKSPQMAVALALAGISSRGVVGGADPALLATILASGTTSGRTSNLPATITAITLLLASGRASGLAKFLDPLLTAALLAQASSRGVSTALDPSLLAALALSGGATAGRAVTTPATIAITTSILLASGFTSGRATALAPTIAAAITRASGSSGAAQTAALSLLAKIVTSGGTASGLATARGTLGIVTTPFEDAVFTISPLLTGWDFSSLLSEWGFSPNLATWTITRTDMPVTRSSIDLRYLRYGVDAQVNGSLINPTGDAVSFAFPASGTPGSGITTWYAASWETVTAPSGSQYVARCLVGPGGTAALAVGSYDVWIKIADNPEIPAVKVDTLTIV